MRHAIVPLDGSNFGRRVLQTVCRVLSPADYEVTLLHVAPLPPGYATPLPAVMLEAWTQRGLDHVEEAVQAYAKEALQTFRADARRHLEADVKCLEQAGFTVSLAVEFGDAASGILRFAEDHPADLILMATHGRGGVSRAVMGSVAARVLRDAHAPVVMLGPKTT